MEVSVCHAGAGDSCVVGVAEDGTVVGLKADALNEMFPGSNNNAAREAENVAAHIEGCEEELDDAQRVADTGLEDGGAVKLVPRWPRRQGPRSLLIDAPRGLHAVRHTVEVWEAVCWGLLHRTHHCV